MTLKPFQMEMTQTLNGIDTFRFNHILTSTESATKTQEGATISVEVDGVAKFNGVVKTVETKYAGKMRSVLVESNVAQMRDTDLAESSARPMTSTKNLLTSILPEGFKLTFLPERNPNIIYAFKSGSIITHFNTICAANGFNWRTRVDPATTDVEIVVAEAGEVSSDVIEMRENVDLFNLKIDTSLFKKYTQVTAIGVEEEVSGYTCVASLNTATYYLLDCDDGELFGDELLPQQDPLSFITGTRAFDLQYGYDLKGWGGSNDVVRINNEFIRIDYKAGSRVFVGERGVWWSADSSTHSYGDPVVLTQSLMVTIPEGQSPTADPATTMFKIGSEIIKGDFVGSAITLATVSATTGLYEGRGLELNTFGTELVWSCRTENVYAHKRGTVVVPYFPDSNPASDQQTLACVIHGKGIVTKDGIDKLAWGVLRNIQNGIVSAIGTYKAGDFFNQNITVGAKARIITATVSMGATSTASVVVPATTYDLIIYSIKRKQNSLIEIEFGNVDGEIMQMLKSGEYALQAALRKTLPPKSESLGNISLKGTVFTSSTGARRRIKW